MKPRVCDRTGRAAGAAVPLVGRLRGSAGASSTPQDTECPRKLKHAAREIVPPSTGGALAVVALLGSIAFVSSAAAQPYDVSWYTIDGGGVMFASGSEYEVGGTIGQPDAGEMTGGDYAVKGGFWTFTPASAAKRPMAEDCATIAPGNRCNTSGTCNTDGDCADESRCVLPPTGGPGSGVCYAPKMRYISLRPHPQETDTTARRIKLSNGAILGWVGEPTWKAGSSVCLASVVGTPYYSATWVCAQDPAGGVHVMGCEIAHASLCPDGSTHCQPNDPCPGSCTHHRYWVQAIAQGQDIGDEGSYSEALELVTNTTWGDTVSDCSDNVCKPPNGLVGLDDIMAAIGYFMGSTAIAPITWLDIDPSNGSQCPDQIIGLGDIMAAIAGFQGEAYPGDGPLDCP